MEYTLVPGKLQGSQLLFAENQLYKLKKNQNGKKLYICYNTGCSAKVVVQGEICHRPQSAHNHSDQTALKDEMSIKDAMKQRCLRENHSAREIFNEEISKNPAAAENIQFGRMVRTLNYSKTLMYPSAPLTAEAVGASFNDPMVRSKYGQSLREGNPTPFYNGTVVEDNFKFSVFSSASMLAEFETINVRHFHVDATFKVVPNGEFTQLLVVHIAHEEHAFPVIYVLMTRKTQATYTRVFQYIEENVCHLRPTSFMSDFEVGMRNAIRSVYPACSVNGCWFHYCQAIRKKSTQLPNFIAFLQENGNAKKLFYKFLALPLVKLDLIPAAYVHLRAETDIFGEVFTEFKQYYARQWMQRETPASFCVFQMASRTNNLVESHNSKLGKKMSPNGNFYKFIEILQKEELIKYFEMRQVIGGALNVYTNQRNAMKTRNSKINALQNKRSAGSLSFEDFLTQVTYVGNGMTPDMDLGYVADIELSENDDDIVDDVPENHIPEEAYDDPILILSRRILEIEEAHDYDVLCTVCRTERKSRLLQPCGHVTVCTQCCNTLQNERIFQCPLCRTVVTSVINAFV